MTPREAILEVCDREDGVALALSRVIKQAEGWRVSDTEALQRVRKCLRGAARRHFEVDWLLLVVDVFVRFDLRDPVVPLLYGRRRDRPGRAPQKSKLT